MNINDLPNPLVGNVMSFADFGGTPESWNVHRPAAKYARVCKRWHEIYNSSTEGRIFVANDELSRIVDWSVNATNPRREGMMQSPIDNRNGWWCSDIVFEGGRWISGVENSEGGPFRLRRRSRAPELTVKFRGTVQLRALLFSARNRPRKVVLVVLKKTSMGARAPRDRFNITMEIPPPVSATEGLAFSSNRELQRYDSLVKRKLPRGSAASERDHRERNLPVVIPGAPFIVEEDDILRIEIIESHERQWLGINALMFYGAMFDKAQGGSASGDNR